MREEKVAEEEWPVRREQGLWSVPRGRVHRKNAAEKPSRSRTQKPAWHLVKWGHERRPGADSAQGEGENVRG